MDTNTPRLEITPKSPRKKILGIHIGGHDSSFAVINEGRVEEIIEFERVFGEKKYRVFPESIRFDKVLKWAFEEYGLSRDFDAVALHIGYFRDGLLEIAIEKIKKYLPNAHYLKLNHHLCHASSVYFTSNFNESVILSYDGYGNDGSTITFTAKGNKIDYIKDWKFRLGTAYRALGSIIGGISSPDNHTAGKTMGLTAYGKVIQKWKTPIKTFIKTYIPIRDQVADWEPSVADGVFYLPGFGAIIGENTFKGPTDKLAQDFATTFQKCWTEITLDIVKETIRDTGISNFCIAGGASLNATTNYYITKLKEVKNTHFIPNPNDCGLAMGAALYYYYSYQNIEWKGYPDKFFSPYKGLPILDADKFNFFIKKYKGIKLENPTKDLAEYISKGKIVGVLQGLSEIGPRALGNRSFLCDPRQADMKDTLNQKVKGREWYRPFAPVVRECDQKEYFDVSIPVPYMSIIGFVKSLWKDKIPAVTHVDGSARLQTISKEQNEFLWDLLGEFKKITNIGVLLNTSFNGRGKPILDTYKEAFLLLETTELDAVYSNGWLFKKNK